MFDGGRPWPRINIAGADLVRLRPVFDLQGLITGIEWPPCETTLVLTTIHRYVSRPSREP